MIIAYVFGNDENYRLDLDGPVLSKGEEKIQLGSTSLRILLHLIRNREVYLNTTKIYNALFQTIGEPSTLRYHISKIGQALADRGTEKKLIGNDGQGGYRFISRLQEIFAPHSELSSSQPNIADGSLA